MTEHIGHLAQSVVKGHEEVDTESQWVFIYGYSIVKPFKIFRDEQQRIDIQCLCHQQTDILKGFAFVIGYMSTHSVCHQIRAEVIEDALHGL